MNQGNFPLKQGLYDPAFEKDACGVGFICSINGEKSSRTVNMGISALKRLSHRGAAGADPETGDGAGILIQTPHKFFRQAAEAEGIRLPAPGMYATGMVFLPREPEEHSFCRRAFKETAEEEGQFLAGWRRLPVDISKAGESAKRRLPLIEQPFIFRGKGIKTDEEFELTMYVIRRRVENIISRSGIKEKSSFCITGLSSRTFAYKGMLKAQQLPEFFKDLKHRSVESALCLFHARYSTNTFPSWGLAQPFRMLAHNGEINTLRGNVNWMRAREGLLEHPGLGGRIKKILPVVEPGGSDSACLDNMLEFLVLSGRPLEHAVMMLMPRAWENSRDMGKNLKDFYEFHGCMMEPWDGPAAIAFTDGVKAGAALDRNGLRPARYAVTKDGFAVMASEAGVLDFAPENILKSGRLEPGGMFLADTSGGRAIEDAEIKDGISKSRPWGRWLKENLLPLENVPAERVKRIRQSPENIREMLNFFGYTREDFEIVLGPTAETGEEPIGSMGDDTPPAALDESPEILYSYFKQHFAQVTNPPIDPIREKSVMSLLSYTGPCRNLLEESPLHARRLKTDSPVLKDSDLLKITRLERKGFRTEAIRILFKAGEEGAFGECVEAAKRQAEASVKSGAGLILLSDRGVNEQNAAVPALLACGAVHQHLVRKSLRGRTGIIVETGEARETHHLALLTGYGADLVNPYGAFAALRLMSREKMISQDAERAENNYIKAADKGILKIMSRMGISALQSYKGAQIFECLGLNRDITEGYFTGTPSRVGGISLEIIEKETLARHRAAYAGSPAARSALGGAGGAYRWRKDGSPRLWNPETITCLQRAVRQNDYRTYKAFAEMINKPGRGPSALRGLLKFASAKPVDITEVEPVSSLVKRFAVGAMSFGSISREAHETIALAMNRLKGMSNTGEGGEDPERFIPLPDRDSLRSSVKQVAAGRFGVTPHYLVNADEIQIKISQGAKPGEGGHLPGHKVNALIARTRYTTPGVTLISPPPHHDIYSIEDLAQLIFDLRNVNPRARISVKLASEAGVGTVAAGAAKGGADMLVISGGNGGTGAAPLSSIRHAGLPWELGLSETHHTLVLNNLRSRVRLQTDGQLRTGRDAAVAAILGAEEFGFCTSALISLGCLMLRHCHLDNCAAGIATQDEILRKRFKGKPEHLINYLTFAAMELREIMARLGAREITDLTGHTELLEVNKDLLTEKTAGLDFSALLYKPDASKKQYYSGRRGLPTGGVLARKLIKLTEAALKSSLTVNLEGPVKIKNSDRAVGAMLSGRICAEHGEDGLPGDAVRVKFRGTAGQSFGAFLAGGVTFELEGASNDYAGKGMFGGRIIMYPDRNASFRPEDNVIMGNTAFYGATRGEAYIRGQAGERFCVRNSGIVAVVEGVGCHGCEYMTGGTAVILGKTGSNFAAGMSGGAAYVYDAENTFRRQCNKDMVETGPLEAGDLEILRSLLCRHIKYTKSKKAESILGNFELHAVKFVKVTPAGKTHSGRAAAEAEMQNAKAFMEEKREEAPDRPVPDRIKDYREVRLPRPRETSSRQASRCMDCGTPFCHWSCPAGNRVPEWNSLLKKGRIEEAFTLLQNTNNFPEITGRLCPAPCEHSCVLGIDDEPVTIRQNELEITEHAFKNGLLKPFKPGRGTGKKIAVAGSGPAGLAAADILHRYGHSITVYEKDNSPGGMLRYGIPGFKLENSVLDRRLELLEAGGVTFKTGTEAGTGLLEEFDAVCLAGGCRKPRDLDIPGRNLRGIYFALDYLSAANRKARGEVMPATGKVNAEGKKVVIIGGGDTGADCLGTAIRQKAGSVMQVELFPEPPAGRTPENPWPYYANILKKSSSHEEGGTRLWGTMAGEFLGRNNRLRGIRFSKAEFSRASGSMKIIPGTGFTMEADMAVLAIGFSGAEPGCLSERLKLRMDGSGRVETDSSFMTSRPKVFAAGDIRRGQSLIVHAMAEGRACAHGINRFLGSKTD